MATTVLKICGNRVISALSIKSNSWLKYFTADSSYINHIYCLRALDGRLDSSLDGKESVVQKMYIEGKEESKENRRSRKLCRLRRRECKSPIKEQLFYLPSSLKAHCVLPTGKTAMELT